MKPFYFKGSVPASKSILNRLLILQSYEPKLSILGDSDCDDVVEMRHALSELGSGYRFPIDCGAAGTTFRFFALRASRVPGEHRLTGSERLMARPQEELVKILRQLGVSAQFEGDILTIHSRGWSKPSDSLKVDRSKSSQFASAVLLNAWGLNFDLEMEFTGIESSGPLSEGYFEITEELVKEVGMRLERDGNRFKIPAKSEITPKKVRAEIDVSSAFAVAALAAVGGEATIENFPEKTRQPDFIFPEILKEMGALVQKQGTSLRIARTGSLKPILHDLKNAPDLFPILSVLCAFADGTSNLYGAPQLVHKESSRIDSTARLIRGLRRDVDVRKDGMIIHGRRPADYPPIEPFEFNPDQDHRLAMAAGVARMAGAPVTVLRPFVVNKSFPAFWELLEPRDRPKRVLVVGHRGTGKTKFLSRVQEYYRTYDKSVVTVDLDQEIAKAFSKPTAQVFTENGEEKFREIEEHNLARLISSVENESRDVFISLGAGFSGKIPDDWQVLWLRRPTDVAGRIFFDRPRLDPKLNVYEEYLQRHSARDSRFKKLQTRTVVIPEGFDFPNPHEEALVLNEVTEIGGAITLLPEHFETRNVRENLSVLKQMGFDYYELRDDLLTEREFEIALTVLRAEKVLFSLRNPARKSATLEIYSSTTRSSLDWPVEYGALPAMLKPAIVSLHTRKRSFRETFNAINVFEHKNRILKLAVPIENFSELKEGHRWWQESPENRVFLPSSGNGRWSWYRTWQKPNYKLNFIREGDGSSADQPYLFDWLRFMGGNEFAAVLGKPVDHSRTPAEHYEYIRKKSADTLAIEISEAEFDEAMDFLTELGLKWAAVTAPLKEKAYQFARDRTRIADDLQSVNTLRWDGSWVGTNTDIGGMEVALRSINEQFPGTLQRKIAIWGGGGTLNALQKLLPNATPFSARTLVRRDGIHDPSFSPEMVIWSVGRSRWEEGNLQFPPESWSPKIVWDLNYAENSPGREYAIKVGAQYISGLEMFEAQAQLQRKFWDRDDS